MDKLPPIDDATIRRTLERARAIFSKVDALRMETKTGSASELMTLMTGSSSEVPTKVTTLILCCFPPILCLKFENLLSRKSLLHLSFTFSGVQSFGLREQYKFWIFYCTRFLLWKYYTSRTTKN